MYILKGYNPWNKGKHLSEETKRKLSLSHIGKSGGMKGKKHSKETKLKMSQNNGKFWLGKKFSKETREKMSLSKRGRVSSAKGKHWKIKDTSKMGKANIGINAWNWIEDRSLLKKRDERNDSAYQEWIKQVKKRDKNICKIKNKDCFGYCIVHHILSWSEYPELRYEINNGITLCQAHHPRKRAEEKRLISDFQRLVSVSNVLI